MADWKIVTLKGTSQVIPKICPNCLAPSTVGRRVSHRFMNTTHWQTFYFCDYCAKQYDAMDNLGLWYFLAFLIAVGLMAATIFAISALFKDVARDSPLVGAAPFVVGLGGGLAFALWRRASAFARFPRKPEQATTGPAAQYVGHGAFGFNFMSAKYRALRSEWIRELVRLNPDQVTDEAYREWTGGPKGA
jgi:hypothetical protein